MSRLAGSLGGLLTSAITDASTTARRIPFIALLLDAWAAFSRDEMPTLAAALGYYFLLALFPLLILLIAALSPLIASDRIISEAVRFARIYVPSGGPELTAVLKQALAARGPITAFALAGLVWSSSGVFDVVQLGMNRAWHVSIRRPLWRQRLVSLLTVIGVALLFLANIGFSFITHMGLRIGLFSRELTITFIGPLFNIILGILLFAVAYKVFPHTNVEWRRVWRASILASITWEIAKVAFSFYILNYSRLNLIYGSVGAVIALLTWGYVTAAILLFGAEVAALEGQARRA